ncbi:MAG TPA: hypothetical protein PK867_10785 [Pirellulales bacterium]|nr:hypothetical protein [Pirellulales bacterium]
MKRDLLDEMADDHVGLWVVAGYMADEMPGADESLIRGRTLDVLAELLESDRIEAGFPDSNGRDFHPWPFPAQAVIGHIASCWKDDGPRPKPGEVCWFTAPTPAPIAGRSA